MTDQDPVHVGQLRKEFEDLQNDLRRETIDCVLYTLERINYDGEAGDVEEFEDALDELRKFATRPMTNPFADENLPAGSIGQHGIKMEPPEADDPRCSQDKEEAEPKPLSMAAWHALCPIQNTCLIAQTDMLGNWKVVLVHPGFRDEGEGEKNMDKRRMDPPDQSKLEVEPTSFKLMGPDPRDGQDKECAGERND